MNVFQKLGAWIERAFGVPEPSPFLREIVDRTENYNQSGWIYVTLECGHWALNNPAVLPMSTKRMICAECKREHDMLALSSTVDQGQKVDGVRALKPCPKCETETSYHLCPGCERLVTEIAVTARAEKRRAEQFQSANATTLNPSTTAEKSTDDKRTN